MNLPTLSCEKLPNGVELQVDRDCDRAKNTAARLGMMTRMTQELRAPGIGVKIAVGIARDEGWLRAIVAGTTDPDVRDVGWMGFSVSPIRHDSRKQLIEMVAVGLRTDPRALRIVEP
ncbi:MAG: hypothetical protein WCS65_17035 [Verrucomicrobiae bacterium]